MPFPRSTAKDFEKRRSKLARELRVRGVEQATLTSGWARPRNFAHNVYPFRAESHFLYLTGLNREGCLLHFERGEFRLFVTERDPELDLWEGPQETLSELSERLGLVTASIEAYGPRPDAAVVPPQDDETATWLGALLERPVEAQSGPELIGADAELAAALVDLRIIHDSAAIQQLRAVCRASAEVHREVMAGALAATNETLIRGRFVGALLGRGLDLAYGPIVTRHGEILHAPAGHAPLQPGDLVLCDVGGESPEGFAGDITRTWPISGRFSASQRAIYELVLSVQEACIARVTPGVEYRDVHHQAHRLFAEGLLALGILRGSVDELLALRAPAVFFPHGLGHLLGLDVHDLEDLGDRAGYAPGRSRSAHPDEAALRLDRPLEVGMVVTIEPGFYQVPGLLERARRDPSLSRCIDFTRLGQFSDVRGIRIEDDVLVCLAGADVLSSGAPKTPSEIEAVMNG